MEVTIRLLKDYLLRLLNVVQSSVAPSIIRDSRAVLGNSSVRALRTSDAIAVCGQITVARECWNV